MPRGSLHADRDLVRRILQNLVHNALRHAPRGSAVEVDARADGGDVIIAVSDAGPGVPAEPREHPRVALVDTATGSVVSTWDRIACGPDPDFVPAPLSSGPSGPTAPVSWPAGSIAVVDMDTNEMIYVLDSPGNG